MRVLIVALYYPPEPVPKPGELAEGLARRGHTVTVLTGFPTYPEGKRHRGFERGSLRIESAGDVRIIRVPTFPDRSDRAWRRAMHYLVFMAGALGFGTFLSGPQDVVYVWGNPPTSGLAGFLLSRLRGARFVYGVHDLWPELAQASGMVGDGWPARAIRRLERFLWRRADLILPVSDGFRGKILAEVPRPNDVITIPHWGDATVYRPVTPPAGTLADLGLAGGVTILYAGNLGRLQGLENLVRAAANLRHEIPRLNVVLAGTGIERPGLERLAAEAGASNVHFLGAVSRERVVELSAAADALYVGLLSDGLAELSVPSKFVTYLACGRPVICNVPGETSRYVSDAGAGVVCTENSAAGIADAIRRFVGLADAPRADMADRALALFRQSFEMEMLLDRHEALMTTLTPGGARP